MGMVERGMQLGLDAPKFPPKPKGMHWSTYRRLEARYYALEDAWAVLAKEAETGSDAPEDPAGDDPPLNTEDRPPWAMED